MQKQIIAELKKIEATHDCRLLYACESGSRAWGFASPDSDYDVRFIYCYPKDEYLRIDKSPDSIDLMLPDDLDLVGWDIRKALKLFVKCNIGLNEWLNSPCVYLKDEVFYEKLKALIPHYFNPKSAMFHYLGITRKMLESNPITQEFNIKKLFYVLRTLLCAQWISEYKSMPPIEFKSVLSGVVIEPNILSKISQLQQQKKIANEGDKIALGQELPEWISSKLAELTSFAEKFSVTKDKDFSPVNALMLEII